MGKSFTIIEILVVSFIISLFSSLSIIYYRNVEKQFALQRSAYRLAQDIKRAQEMAMAAKECKTGMECEGRVPSGYGIYIARDGTDYILYADINPPPQGGNKRYDAENEIVETISLEKGVKVSSILPASANPNAPNTPWININFSPPDPEITISLPAGTTTSVTTTLSLVSNPLIQKKININIMGLVEIK